MPTHYEILGVDSHVTRAEIRRAFLDRAKEHHPDRTAASADGNPSISGLRARRAMQEINAAWAVLGDPATRAAYDESIGVEHRSSASRTETAGLDGGKSVVETGTASDDYHDHRNDCDCGPADGCGYVHSQWDVVDVSGRMPSPIERPDRDPNRVGLKVGIAVIFVVLVLALGSLAVVTIQGRGSATSMGDNRFGPSGPVVGVTPAAGSSAGLDVGNCLVLALIEGRIAPLGSSCSGNGAFRISGITRTGRPCADALEMVDIETEQIRLCLTTP